MDALHHLPQIAPVPVQSEDKLIRLLLAAEEAGFGQTARHLTDMARKSMHQTLAIRHLLTAHNRTKRRLRQANDDKDSLLALMSPEAVRTWKAMRKQERSRNLF